MPLKVSRRKDRGTLQIEGWVTFPDGSRQRIRKTPESKNIKLAHEEAAALEARLLREAWHGERRGARPFAEAVESYLDSAPRAPGDRDRLLRIVAALGDVPLSAVNQEAINRLRKKILKPDAAPATVSRGIIVPVRAVMRHAYRLGWCDPPVFESPKRTSGRTNYLVPSEMKLLLVAAAPHVKPLLIFLVCTGARMSEAIELEWRDVDLIGARATFWKTKTRYRRVAKLPPAAIATLSDLAERCPTKIDGRPVGRVFRWQTVTPKRKGKAPARIVDYADRNREYGGHIRTAWKGAIRRGVLDPDLKPHDLRHTWASWHYAIHRDLLALKVEGDWSSVTLVERYAHLLPAGHEAEITAFWAGETGAATEARHHVDTAALDNSVSR